MVPLEQALVGLPVEEVELEFAPGHRFEPHAVGLLEDPAVYGPRCGLEGLAVVPLGVADQAGGLGRPGHDGGGGGIGEQQLVSVADLFVVETSGNYIGACVENRGAPVHVEALACEAGGGVERHDLGAGGAVQVGQLEPYPLDSL